MLSISCEKSDSFSDSNSTNSIEQKKIDNFRVSKEMATAFATNFMNKHSKLKSTLSVTKTTDFKLPINNRKLFVVQFEPYGFVLMSDNLKNIPVLAFSENSTFGYTDFEQLPVGMKEWVSETILLNYEIENDTVLQKANDVMFEWQTNLPKLKNTKIIDPDECYYTYLGHSKDIYDDCILETHWHQRLPYNLYTPICSNNNKHTPAGCVSIAMSQIMKYWEYPNRYNWDILLNRYPYYSTTTSAYTVANLIKDIGTDLNTDYDCESSSANRNKAKKVFYEDYGYSGSIKLDDFHIDDIKNNLMWGYPVYLRGNATRINILNTYWYKDGHAWVCDGLWEEYDNFKVTFTTGGGVPLISYETRNYRCYLHMNWGHGDIFQNIWYFSNNLTHPINSDYDFKWNKEMIINIHP